MVAFGLVQIPVFNYEEYILRLVENKNLGMEKNGFIPFLPRCVRERGRQIFLDTPPVSQELKNKLFVGAAGGCL